MIGVECDRGAEGLLEQQNEVGRRRVAAGVAGEAGMTEGAQRLGHPEPRGLPRVPDDERAVDQVGQCIGVSADGEHSAVFHRSREYRQPAEQRPPLLAEESVGPTQSTTASAIVAVRAGQTDRRNHA